MKVKQSWMIGEEFVMDSKLFGSPTERVHENRKKYRKTLIKAPIFMVSRVDTCIHTLRTVCNYGIMEEQQHYGVIPNGWSCYYNNKPAILRFSCSGDNATADVNVLVRINFIATNYVTVTRN